MDSFFPNPIPGHVAADFLLDTLEKSANARVGAVTAAVPAALALLVGAGLGGAHYGDVKRRDGGRSTMEIDTEAEMARLEAQNANDGKTRPLLLALGRLKKNYAQEAAKSPALAAALYATPGAALTAGGAHAAMTRMAPLLKNKGLLSGTRLGTLLGHR